MVFYLQMTIESNYTIAIATLSDWASKPRTSCVTNEKKTKINHTLHALFFRALRKSHVIAWNSDWLIALVAFVVISLRNYFGICFSTVIWKTAVIS